MQLAKNWMGAAVGFYTEQALREDIERLLAEWREMKQKMTAALSENATLRHDLDTGENAIIALEKQRDDYLEIADDACELMELAGLHDESGYKRLKDFVEKFDAIREANLRHNAK